jgi:predicted N-acetyltransferase YhbS
MRTAFSAATSSTAAATTAATNELSTNKNGLSASAGNGSGSALAAGKSNLSDSVAGDHPRAKASRPSRAKVIDEVDSAADEAYYWPLGVTAVPQEDFRLAPATAGDHAAIHQLLTTVFQGPGRDEFSASLEDPFYEPCDRLIVKRGLQVVGHVHLAQRSIRLGDEVVPATVVHRLGVLPEYRGRGFAGRLLAQTDVQMRADGSVLGLLSTRRPHFFRTHGWVVCMRHSRAQVGARDLLAQLSARGYAPHSAGDELNIRPWRHVELPSLVRLYAESTAASYGPYERTEAYWRWLVNRHSADGLLVALAGPKRFDFDVNDDSIVGYAIVKDDTILEVAASQKHPGVKERLLARACGEAIERDMHVVKLHLSPDDSAWEMIRAAGGVEHRGEQCDGEVTMVKLLDPIDYLRRLAPKLHDRATAVRLKRPQELSLVVGDQAMRITATRRSVKIAAAAPGRAWVKLCEGDFTRLLLGHLDVEEGAACGRVKSSNRAALRTAAVLFPRLPLWHPPLDDQLV